jgi:hypothetical protein
MPAPAIDPDERDPQTVASTDLYKPRDQVWVYRDGAWRKGTVDMAAGIAATVTYQLRGGGNGTDTVTARYICSRAAEPAPAGPLVKTGRAPHCYRPHGSTEPRRVREAPGPPPPSEKVTE